MAEAVEIPLATSQDGSVQPPHEVCTFFEQAGLALCCEPRKVVRDVPVGLLVVRATRRWQCMSECALATIQSVLEFQHDLGTERHRVSPGSVV